MPGLADHLEKLQHFVAAARAGSVSAAAVRLRISQPAISRSVKSLESALGVELFLRTSRGMRLTEAGEFLLRESGSLLENLERVELTLKRGEQSGPRNFRLGMKEPYAIHLLPVLLRDYRLGFPGSSVQISVQRTNLGLLRDLREERVDAVLAPNPADHEEIVAYSLFEDAMRLFAPVGGTDETTLYVFGTAIGGTGETIEQTLRASAWKDLPVVDVDSYEAVLAMVSNGLGRGLLPMTVARAAWREGTIRLEKETESRRFGTFRVCLCLHARNARAPAFRGLVKSFLTTSRRCFRL